MNNTGVKSGGRKKGTPNKLTKELRTILKNLISDELEHLPFHLEKLDSKSRIELVTKLLPFALPRVDSEGYKVSEQTAENRWDLDF
jgi:hypothetical protein